MLTEWYLPKILVEFRQNDIRLLHLGGSDSRLGRSVDERVRTRNFLRDGYFRDKDRQRQQWETVRKDFISRNLTKVSDMLPAIAGIAQILEDNMRSPDHRYLAGLWSSYISEDMT